MRRLALVVALVVVFTVVFRSAMRTDRFKRTEVGDQFRSAGT